MLLFQTFYFIYRPYLEHFKPLLFELQFQFLPFAKWDIYFIANSSYKLNDENKYKIV